jgi:hypothetical protein
MVFPKKKRKLDCKEGRIDILKILLQHSINMNKKGLINHEYCIGDIPSLGHKGYGNGNKVSDIVLGLEDDGYIVRKEFKKKGKPGTSLNIHLVYGKIRLDYSDNEDIMNLINQFDEHKRDLGLRDYIPELLRGNTDINIATNNDKLIKESQGHKSLILSHLNQTYFENTINNVLVNIFFNNPDIWHNINNKEDLDFSISIKANWSTDEIFKRFVENKELSINDKMLYPIINKYRVGYRRFNKNPDLDYKMRKDYMQNGNTKAILGIASLDTNDRLEWYNEKDKEIKERKPKYLKVIDDELEKNLEEWQIDYLKGLRNQYYKVNKYISTIRFYYDEPILFWCKRLKNEKGKILDFNWELKEGNWKLEPTRAIITNKQGVKSEKGLHKQLKSLLISNSSK